jgi:hypothetical protein
MSANQDTRIENVSTNSTLTIVEPSNHQDFQYQNPLPHPSRSTQYNPRIEDSSIDPKEAERKKTKKACDHKIATYFYICIRIQ